MQTQEYSNFITPPDFVNEKKHTVFIMDADWNEVENIALWCQNVDTYFNVYLYEDIMCEEEWAVKAVELADAIIINSRNGTADAMKGLFLKLDKVWYYGQKNYLRTDNRLDSPLDYFVQYHERQQNSAHSL